MITDFNHSNPTKFWPDPALVFVYLVVLGQTQFVGSEFGMFGGFGWVCSSVLVGKLGFGRVRSLVFPDLGLGSAHFWPNMFEVRAFCRGSKFGFGG